MTLWEGGFTAGPDPAFWRYGQSGQRDMRLAPYDLEGSRVHARLLCEAGYLSEEEGQRMEGALSDLAKQLEAGQPFWTEQDEDVHSAIERTLTDRLGELGAKLHAGRSRNDQVALALHLFAKDHAARLAGAVRSLQATLTGRARDTFGAIVPAYTHLQQAQPVLFSHVLLAYVAMLDRDAKRLDGAAAAADQNPLGSGAVAGSGLPLDRTRGTELLGLSAPYANSIDAVSDRDFELELLFAVTTLLVHLSRLSEDLVLWSSREFSWIRLDDAWSTGSSLMPQKKNPDGAELTRARAALSIGALTGLLSLLKGLPMAYNRDLQEDKAPLFDSVDGALGALAVLEGMIQTLVFLGPPPIPDGDPMLATDLADALVEKGVPFRTAHHMAARLVRQAEAQGTGLDGLAPELVSEVTGAKIDDLSFLTVAYSLARRTLRGGTAPAQVEAELSRWEAHLGLRSR